MFVKNEAGRWEQLIPFTLDTIFGPVVVPVGDTDLFTGVPNTEYEEYWISARLHDFMRASKAYNRWQSDVAFLLSMIHASITIHYDLLQEGVSEAQSLRVMVKLIRRACYYTLGVSGPLGSIYIGISKITRWWPF